jgi:hypothetical protein
VVTSDVKLSGLLLDTSLVGIFCKGMAGGNNQKTHQDRQNFGQCANHYIFAFCHRFSLFSMMDFFMLNQW